ncbi:MAG: PAS domain S-box-containing protein [Saprospiraceae bacterium]|jgi:PAS domain S-box-containing protein
MLIKYFNEIINVGTSSLTDENIIIRVKAMNRLVLAGVLICLFTTAIGFLIQHVAFIILGISIVLLLLISFYLISKDRYKIGWYLIFTVPIQIFTLLPIFLSISPALLVFFISFQFSILVIFRNPKVLFLYFAFYSFNTVLFTILLFYYFPDHINLDLIAALIDIIAGIVILYLSLKFYMQTRIVNEKILELEENKFRTVFENSPIGIIITRLNGNYEKIVNSSVVHSLGYEQSILERMSISQMTHPEDRDIHQKEFKQLLLGEVDYLKLNKRYLHRDGHTVWGTTILSTTQDEDGEPNYIIAMFLDISEQKSQEVKITHLVEKLKISNAELEDRVNRRTADLSIANEELQRSNQDLEQFAYAASHDLKEPLRMISSFVQILERKYSDKIDDKGKEYIKFTVEGASRMSDLISSLLQYSKVGRKESKLRTAKIANLVELKLMDLQQLIEEKNAQVNILELPETVICESVQVGLVFYNLINNALKFNNNETPIVNIGGKERAEDYLFTIQDNGIGIKDKFKEQVFEIFKRLHVREEYEGTGIGLALCRRIIYRHDGDVWFESEIGKGTTFYFTIKKGLLEAN